MGLGPLSPLKGPPVAKISLLIFNQPIPCLHTSYQSQRGFLCIAQGTRTCVQLDFKQLSVMASCTLVLVLARSLEEASTAFTYSILTGSPPSRVYCALPLLTSTVCGCSST